MEYQVLCTDDPLNPPSGPQRRLKFYADVYYRDYWASVEILLQSKWCHLIKKPAVYSNCSVAEVGTALFFQELQYILQFLLRDATHTYAAPEAAVYTGTAQQ